MLRWKRQRSLSRWPPAAYPESGPATRAHISHINPTSPENTGSKSNAYWKLTDVEKLMPLVFLLLFAGITVYGICFT